MWLRLCYPLWLMSRWWSGQHVPWCHTASWHQIKYELRLLLLFWKTPSGRSCTLYVHLFSQSLRPVTSGSKSTSPSLKAKCGHLLLGLLLHLLGLALSRPLRVQRMVAGRIAVGEPVLWWNTPDAPSWHGQGGRHTENGPPASLWV